MVVRLYSHMVRSIVEDRWVPDGMPGFAKLVEGLDRRGVQTDVLFLCKDVIEGIRQSRFSVFADLENTRFFTVPIRSFPRTRLQQVRNDYHQFRHLWRLLTRSRHDLIYCDRGHVVFGALCTLLGKRVVIRLFGVGRLPDLLCMKAQRAIPSLTAWSFRAGFKAVICSKDGSPGRSFIERYMRKDLPAALLYHGVDPVPPCGSLAEESIRNRYGLPDGTPVIMTTGSLRHDKSSEEFIAAIVELSRSIENFFVVNVGDGPLRNKLEEVARREGLVDRVVFVGRVSHHTIYGYLEECDIYVSLNQYGNLSNATLEAMNAGKCIVTFKTCQASGRDEETEDAELRSALVLIDRSRLSEQLPKTLERLIKYPEDVHKKAAEMRQYADKHLRSWEHRIRHEIDLLRRVARS